MWQDIVVTTGQFLFFVALIPTIRAKEKPAFSTALLTSIVLTAYLPTFWTLKLNVSVVSTILVAAAWWTITYQVWAGSRRKGLKPGETVWIRQGIGEWEIGEGFGPWLKTAGPLQVLSVTNRPGTTPLVRVRAQGIYEANLCASLLSRSVSK